VTGFGEASRPPLGPMSVTLGMADAAALSSTYSNTEAAFTKLDSPLLSVTVTAAGPAPSSGLGELGGAIAAAGGKTAVSVVLLTTANPLACALPTWTLETFGATDVPKPDPEIVTE